MSLKMFVADFEDSGHIIAAMEKAKTKIQFSVRYGLKKGDLDRLRAGIMECLVPVVTPEKYVNANVTISGLDDGLQRTTTFATVSEWLSAISLAAENCWLSVNSGDFSITVDMRPAEVKINVGGPEEQAEELKAVVKKFAEMSGLNVVAMNPYDSLRGERRQFYPEGLMTKDWLERCLALLMSYEGSRTGFIGRIGEKGKESTYQDFKIWKQEIDARWNGLQTVAFWRNDAAATQSMNLDFDRQQITLELRALPVLSGQRGLMFEDFIQELGLTPIVGRPYQYYRFARKYVNRNDWVRGDDSKTADAISAAVGAAFPEGRYALLAATVTEGDSAEEQLSFDTLEDFLARLRKEQDYRYARMTLQGPRGADLYVQVSRGEKSVLVRSSIADARQFKKIEDAFEGLQSFRLDKIENRPAEGAAEKKEKTKWERWQPVVTPVIAGVVTFFVSGIPTRKTTLEITVPAKSASGEVQVTGDRVPVRWTVVSKTMIGEIPGDLPATVTIKESGGEYKKDYPEVRPGVEIPLPKPGVYYLTVNAGKESKAAEQSVRVVVSAAKTQDAGGAAVH